MSQGAYTVELVSYQFLNQSFFIIKALLCIQPVIRFIKVVKADQLLSRCLPKYAQCNCHLSVCCAVIRHKLIKLCPDRWPRQMASSNGLCRYGGRIDCCWGWTRVSWGQCQRE